MRLRCRWALLLVPAAFAAAVPAHADERDWWLASDVAAGTLIVWSVAVPLAAATKTARCRRASRSPWRRGCRSCSSTRSRASVPTAATGAAFPRRIRPSRSPPGAAIGWISGVLFTDRHPNRRATIAVWGDTSGGGMSFGMTFHRPRR